MSTTASLSARRRGSATMLRVVVLGKGANEKTPELEGSEVGPQHQRQLNDAV